MIQLISKSRDRELSNLEKKHILLSGNLRFAAYCEYCLTRIGDVNNAVYQNDNMFCSAEHAREYRVDGLVNNRTQIKVNL
jgi:hypothetical protein